MKFILCILSLQLISTVFSFESYQHNIPNGHNIPHPCKPDHIWRGVGHKVAAGGKHRNFFGKDFKQAGHVWTPSLCRKDSDGDGRTNGEELGDPNCIWIEGQHPERNTDITHPGVCEPWNHPKCQEQLKWLKPECQTKEFKCDAIHKDGVLNMTVKFPKTKVPASETTYMCVVFSLPTDADYHLIATKPIIDNVNIVHHGVLFGCEDDAELTLEPSVCDMVPSNKCTQILSTWTIGFSGDCVHNLTGFRIGVRGYKRAALQFHWNNPSLHTNYTDESGMVLYYTGERRVHDAGILTVGANYLHIPPRTEQTKYISYCPSQCSRLFITDKVYISSAHNHMHYLGVSQTIEQFRNGTKLRDITSELMYNYDSPQVFKYQAPLELLPGDSISTTCTYNSLRKNTTTYFGDSTSDEMCFGFITYFPKQNLDVSFCTSWKSIPMCLVRAGLSYNGCYLREFLKLENPKFIFLFKNVLRACELQCSKQCLDFVKEVETVSCLQGDLGEYIKSFTDRSPQFRIFFSLLEKCVVFVKSANMSFGLQHSMLLMNIVYSLHLIIYFIL